MAIFRPTSVSTYLLLLGVIAPMAAPFVANAQPNWTANTIAEKKLAQLPSGPLYWEVETFATAPNVEATATSLSAEVAGKSWRFTLGPKGTATPGGTKMAEIGPVPPVEASEYMLRVLNVSGPRGAGTPVHMHPGSEAFYVVTGQLTQKTQHGVSTVAAGQAMAGHGADTVMQVSSSADDDLDAFVLFVVDANKQFFVPTKFE